ncbi:hypothetical protein Q9233_015922 [Columba guinea]|nr:hypothetical protein Q9233_015922 [Columba guinea]
MMMGRKNNNSNTQIFKDNMDVGDVIVGIVDGTVVEMGTHTELTEKKEPHYSLLTSQMMGQALACAQNRRTCIAITYEPPPAKSRVILVVTSERIIRIHQQ